MDAVDAFMDAADACVDAQRRIRRAGLILLVLCVLPVGASGQWGEVSIEVGGSRAFAPSGTDVPAATHLTLGLRADRWTSSGSGVFAGLYGGMATGPIGGNWGSFVAGGQGVLGSGGPVEFSLSATAYGFAVGNPYVYEALTVVARPELRVPMGPAAIVLYGEAGRGSSHVEFHRDTLTRSFTHDLWHYGWGPELQVRFGSVLTSASFGTIDTETGTYRKGEFQIRAGSNRFLITAALSVWDTPLGTVTGTEVGTGTGTETTGSISITVPLGGPRWFARMVGGRTDPDPLVRSEAGGLGGLVVGRRLVRFGPGGPAPVVAVRPTTGGGEARFEVENEDAQRVDVLGDFTGWDPKAMVRDDGTWSLDISLPAGTYHFGFLVDGEWFVPETAPGQVSDDWGQVNATIVVP